MKTPRYRAKWAIVSFGSVLVMIVCVLMTAMIDCTSLSGSSLPALVVLGMGVALGFISILAVAAFVEAITDKKADER